MEVSWSFFYQRATGSSITRECSRVTAKDFIAAFRKTLKTRVDVTSPCKPHWHGNRKNLPFASANLVENIRWNEPSRHVRANIQQLIRRLFFKMYSLTLRMSCREPSLMFNSFDCFMSLLWGSRIWLKFIAVAIKLKSLRTGRRHCECSWWTSCVRLKYYLRCWIESCCYDYFGY